MSNFPLPYNFIFNSFKNIIISVKNAKSRVHDSSDSSETTLFFSFINIYTSNRRSKNRFSAAPLLDHLTSKKYITSPYSDLMLVLVMTQTIISNKIY